MAAIESSKTRAAPATSRHTLGGIVLAACALPGVLPPGVALADEAPNKNAVEFKLSGYNEWQTANSSTSSTSSASASSASSGPTVSISAASSGSSGSGSSSSGSSGGSSSGGSSSSSSSSNSVNRVKVLTPSVSIMLPLGHEWSLQGSGTIDQVSGASPRYYSDTSSFSNFKDTRKAADAKLTRYFRRQSVSVGVSTSLESDYKSNAASLEGRWSTEDQNTTFNLGAGVTRDTINPSNLVVVNAHKSVNEVQIGVTQALSKNDLVQVGYTHISQSGYLNDPYKSWDNRPDTRTAQVVQTRWNHWLGEATLKTGYRWYSDTFGIQAHTFDIALVIPFDDNQTSAFTPEFRWYTQSAARFYVPVDTSSSTYPQPADTSGYTSLDQRLSAFGAVTIGGKLEWPVADGWQANIKLAYYHQASSLRLIDTGSKGLDPVSAAIWQVGFKHSF